MPSKGLYASPAASKILYLFRWVVVLLGCERDSLLSLSPLTSQSLFLKFSRFVCFVCRWEEEGEGEREGEGEEEEEEEKGALRRGRGGSKWGQ